MAVFKIFSPSPPDFDNPANFSKIGLSRFKNDFRLRCPEFKSLFEIKNGDETLAVTTGFMNEIRLLEFAFKVTVTFSAELCSATSNVTDVRSTAFLKEKQIWYLQCLFE